MVALHDPARSIESPRRLSMEYMKQRHVADVEA